MTTSPKQTGPWNKPRVENDPRVTPWSDEEYSETLPQQPPRKRARSLRDWAVLALAFLLIFYVVMFLIGGLVVSNANSATNTTSSGSRFSFLSGGEIAVIPIHGEISSATSKDSVGYADVIAALEDADADPAISVIFLDISSGGGGVVPSKQIVSKIREVEKPVVSWIGEVGASGAYYIAASSDYILADGDSITGSIGVISMLPSFDELMQKIGVKMNTVKTGELKDAGSPFNEFTEEERAIFQTIVDEAFDAFKSDVQSFRGEKLNAVKFPEVLDGRILSGRQALSVGLIDELGTREQAIAKAAALGQIDGKPTLVYYLQRTPTLMDLLFSAGASFGSGIESKINPLAKNENGAIQAK